MRILQIVLMPINFVKGALYLVVPLVLCVPLDLGAQTSYPQLYKDGSFLAVTAFKIQERSGSGWRNASVLHPHLEYRFRVRLTNLSKDALTYGDPFNLNISIAQIHLTIFHPTIGKRQVMAGNSVVLPSPEVKSYLFRGRYADEHDNDISIVSVDEFLLPEKSYWHSTRPFVWLGTVQPVNAVSMDFQIQTSHRELRMIKEAARQPIRVN